LSTRSPSRNSAVRLKGDPVWRNFGKQRTRTRRLDSITSTGCANTFSMNPCGTARIELRGRSAEGQVVDPVAKRRNILALGGVEFDSQNIIAMPVDVRREFEREWSVAAQMLAEFVAVERDRGRDHGAIEIDEDEVVFQFRRDAKVAAINGSELVALVVKAVPGKRHVGVRQRDAFEAAVVETGSGSAFDILAAVQPITVEPEDVACGQLRRGGHGGEPALPVRRNVLRSSTI